MGEEQKLTDPHLRSYYRYVQKAITGEVSKFRFMHERDSACVYGFCYKCIRAEASLSWYHRKQTALFKEMVRRGMTSHSMVVDMSVLANYS